MAQVLIPLAIVTLAVVGIWSAVSTHKAQEDAAAAEAAYQEEQDKILIAEAETKIQVLREEMTSLIGQGQYEYGQIGKKGYATYGAQRALFGFGGAELGAGGSPLVLEAATLEAAQADLSYRQGWYAAELSRRQAEVAGLQEQIDIINQAHGWGGKNVPAGIPPISTPLGVGVGTRMNPPERSPISQPLAPSSGTLLSPGTRLATPKSGAISGRMR